MSIILPEPDDKITWTRQAILDYGIQCAKLAVGVDRASRVPMTRVQGDAIDTGWFQKVSDGRMAFIRAVEKHHGIITPKYK